MMPGGPWTVGRCFYCALPVRFGGDGSHPGRGVVDQVAGAHTTDMFGLPNLRLLHEFCRAQLGSRTNRRRFLVGLAMRRARLGRATERHEAGLPIHPHDRLGVDPVLRTGAYPKYWRVTKMRYAMRACKYYAGAH
ncbi:hypothetical protein EV193_104250 [Herbihabitans rhizosphaerae]|uniref:Uncharacterized protein n=1 Tax=Herbihabitans rhizosphaerae TaxID=1872711 RepID=A0A4Q7KQF3_9PSEU|nr:hypothetical protein [Herbihabitans rhizosphaerae]RZS39039.1 hypothetical protein EV193_104250 [Herbihabitans rhizosphaerae]